MIPTPSAAPWLLQRRAIKGMLDSDICSTLRYLIPGIWLEDLRLIFQPVLSAVLVPPLPVSWLGLSERIRLAANGFWLQPLRLATRTNTSGDEYKWVT